MSTGAPVYKWSLLKPPTWFDMGVGANDGFDGEAMAANEVQDAGDFVAGSTTNRFARDRIADDGAIALENPHRDGDVNQAFGGGIQGRQTVAHRGL